ncbi:uncharacterized protein PG998_005368 [Apiospora kogelbergensis]|uniref:Uncharacterized protein n=1 Tax=Apiospora kogelbergensis TaxID=1337665 RepID=A0AAW0Q8R2_9PEZI
MSFGVALQSAIFYVVACTPCAQAREHRDSKKKAKRDREEKNRMQAEMPELYQHPDPFNTNPYWSEEITMGPRLPSKKNANASWSDDWNKKRYQREDEELWGRSRTGHKLVDAIKQAGTAAGRKIEATLGMEKDSKNVTEEERTDFYSPTVKNPPVNDYHPPVVSQRPRNKGAAQWMLQPPPPAKIMEGKVPSRSMSLASQASRRTAASTRSARTMTGEGPPLGKRMHEKMVEKKLRQGSDTPTEAELAAALNRPSTARRSTNASRSVFRHLPEMKVRRKRRSRVPVTPEIDSSDDEEFYRGNSIESLGAMTRAAQRPKLETIFSSQNSAPKSEQSKRPQTPENKTKVRSPAQETFNKVPMAETLVPAPNKDVSMSAGVAVQASA